MTNDNPISARLHNLQAWLAAVLASSEFELEPMTGDASFRRYFRLMHQSTPYVVMDAPPEKLSVTPYVDIAHRLQQAGVRAPEIYHQNEIAGFLLLENFGDTLLLDVLKTQPPEQHYQQAFDTLLHIQTIDATSLPTFDAKYMQQELDLFTEWFLNKLIELPLPPTMQTQYQQLCDTVIAQAQTQPQVFIHLDYHSRNLMILPDKQLGVLDFQDAKRGPVTYDLVSLLRDAYIAWPFEQVRNWVKVFYQKMPNAAFSEAEFVTWFDWMSVQRLLKVIGIFARLSIRDGKSAYLNDIPRVLTYLLDVCQRYEALQPWYTFLKAEVAPRIFK